MILEMEKVSYYQSNSDLTFYEKMESANTIYLEKLRQNYTIHTFSVINVTGQVDYLEFTDDLDDLLNLNTTDWNLYQHDREKRPWDIGAYYPEGMDFEQYREVSLSVLKQNLENLNPPPSSSSSGPTTRILHNPFVRQFGEVQRLLEEESDVEKIERRKWLTEEQKKLKETPDFRELTFTIHTKAPNSALHTYTVSPTLKVMANNLYISSQYFHLKFLGREKSSFEVKYDIIDFLEPSFHKYSLHILAIIFVTLFLVYFIFKLLDWQNKQVLLIRGEKKKFKLELLEKIETGEVQIKKKRNKANLFKIGFNKNATFKPKRIPKSKKIGPREIKNDSEKQSKVKKVTAESYENYGGVSSKVAKIMVTHGKIDLQKIEEDDSDSEMELGFSSESSSQEESSSEHSQTQSNQQVDI